MFSHLHTGVFASGDRKDSRKIVISQLGWARIRSEKVEMQKSKV
jgi:hypothetical protein